MITLISLLILAIVPIQGFNIARPTRRMTAASSKSFGQLFTPMRQERVSLQLTVGADAKDKMVGTVVAMKTKAEQILKAIMTLQFDSSQLSLRLSTGLPS